MSPSRRLLPLALALAAVAPAASQTRIGEVSTTFRWVGPNDKVVVERFDDPKVANVACWISRADTGGVSGGLGLAEDPARYGIACAATGPARIAGEIARDGKGEIVFDERASALFKKVRVTRFLDAERNALVYLVWSTITVSTEGSPYNALAVIPLAP
jgi:CreA protein